MILDEHYRGMSPAEKWAVLGKAWSAARTLQLTGLRSRFPDESEADLELRLGEQWLGAELFRKVRSYQASLSDG